MLKALFRKHVDVFRRVPLEPYSLMFFFVVVEIAAATTTAAVRVAQVVHA